VSECGIDGPPEQETDRTRAHTRANDKWAQEGTRGPKGKVGGATARPADLLVGRLGPWAPPPQLCHVVPPCCLLKSVLQRWAANSGWLPPINTRGGVEEWTHISHPLNSPFSLGAWDLHPRCLGRLGGVEEEEESEEESAEVPGLSALVSACTSTDAYSVVSVRDFLCLFIWN